MNYWLIFLTGLTSGGISCGAMQGALLSAIIANQKEAELEEVRGVKVIFRRKEKNNLKSFSFDQLDWMPVGIFLISKILIHTLLGFLLGVLGGVITLSLGFRLVFQVFAALFMIATALNLLDAHPIFRYVMFQPPKFLQRLIHNSTKSKAFFTPAVFGLLTIFIPCGVTQAMEISAINSGNGLTGALTMLFFILGTSPMFALIGVATAKLSEGLKDKFLKTAAVILILMGLYSINGVLTVLDFPITWQKITRPVSYFFSEERFQKVGGGYKAVKAQIVNNVQKITINVDEHGYDPRYFKVKLGIPVELTVKTNDVYSCATSFTFSKFAISANLKPTDSQTFKFTPKEKGKFTFACSAGVYTGVMEVY